MSIADMDLSRSWTIDVSSTKRMKYGCHFVLGLQQKDIDCSLEALLYAQIYVHVRSYTVLEKIS